MAAEPISVFDKTAADFAAAADHQTQRGRYLRAELFVSAAEANVPRNGQILDYGCGPGRIARLLAHRGFDVLGLDPSEGMLVTARQQSLAGLKLRFQWHPSGPITLPGGNFDAVVCSSVIEYVDDPDDLLQSFRRLLKPDGTLIISFANRLSLWRRWCRLRNPSVFTGAQKRMWKWSEFRSLLQRNGFRPMGRPTYFEWRLDRIDVLRAFFGGTLGLVVAKKKS